GYLGPTETVGRMVVVQQLLHGLTGGEAMELRAVATDVVSALRKAITAGSNDSNHLCALGFALHLTGDSFAHTRLDDMAKKPAERRMYPTGKGHAPDYGWPDHPLHTGARAGEWIDYLKKVGADFTGTTLDLVAIDPFIASAQSYVKEHGQEA